MMNLMVKPTEVSAKATRRRFTTAEKIRILREADACAHEKGAVTALLRREGLYSSHLTNWRKQRDAGQFGKAARRRGPVATPPDPRDKKIAELERSLRRVQAERDRYERLCALQKKCRSCSGSRWRPRTKRSTDADRRGDFCCRWHRGDVRRTRRVSRKLLPVASAARVRPASADALPALAVARRAPRGA